MAGMSQSHRCTKTQVLTSTSARALDHFPAGTQVVAEIREDISGKFYLASYASFDLHISTSCLVMPQHGDRVRAIVDQKCIFITDILLRKSRDPLILSSHGRELQIISPELVLKGKKSVMIESDKISLFARSSQWVADRMQQITRLLFIQADNAHKKVKHTDEVEAECIQQEAEKFFAIKGRLTSVKGSSVLKVDGGQIHMG